jgi:hypothetical protein
MVLIHIFLISDEHFSMCLLFICRLLRSVCLVLLLCGGFCLFLRQGLTMQPSLASNSWSSCLRLPGTGITSVHHHAQQFFGPFLVGFFCFMVFNTLSPFCILDESSIRWIVCKYFLVAKDRFDVLNLGTILLRTFACESSFLLYLCLVLVLG